MTRLAPCPSCRRHVKLDELVCPFCAMAFSALAPSSGDGARRMGRVAAIALVAGVSAGATACDDGGGPAPEYGAPPPDAGEDDDVVDGGGDDAGG